VLLVFGAPCQLPLLAGPEHGRTIPLVGYGRVRQKLAAGTEPKNGSSLVGVEQYLTQCNENDDSDDRRKENGRKG